MERHACIVVAVLAVQVGGAIGCSVIAVGRHASASGYPMVTHSDDSGPTTTDIRLIRVPRKRWPPQSLRPLYHWSIPYPRVVSSQLSPEYAPVQGQVESEPIGHIPQVAETWAYWDTDYGVQNEWGLSIGESTSTAMTVGWPVGPGRPFGYNHVGIEDLTKIAMERCKSARCAVQTMGSIAVEQGFYSSDSGSPEAPAYFGSAEALVVADAEPGDVWIFNVLTGRNNASAIWAAQRMPPEHVAAVGNTFTIRKLNLSDTENFLTSPEVTALAEEKGWGRPVNMIFDFFSAYGYQPPPGGLRWDPPGVEQALAYYSGRRMWRVFSLLSPAEGIKLDPNKGNLPKTHNPYPPSVPAARGSVTLSMVMSVHRDHYEGTPYDLTQGMAAGPFGNPNRGKAPPGLQGQWERALAMFRTAFSFVNVAKPNRRSVLWFGYDAAHGTAYLPFYGAAQSGAPPGYHSHEGCQSKFSFEVAWWAFNAVNQLTDRNFAAINAEVRAKAQRVEEEGQQAVEAWEREAGALGNGTAQLAFLTARSNAFAEATVAAWWQLLWAIFVKYGRLVVTYNESASVGTDALGQAYPEWWLRSPDVGFTAWSPQGPFHGVADERSCGVGVAAAAGAPTRSAALWPVSTTRASAVVALGLAVFGATAVAVFRAGVRAGRQQGLRAVGYVTQP